jgi:hypothetical protein
MKIEILEIITHNIDPGVFYATFGYFLKNPNPKFLSQHQSLGNVFSAR